MTWRELSHEDGHMLVEYANGLRLNVRYDHLIEANDPDRPAPTAPGPRISVVVTRYGFAAGAVLPEHAHDVETLHDIVVESGRVRVCKESGDVEAGPGDRVDLKVNERHSIEAITDAVTLHTLVPPWTRSSS